MARRNLRLRIDEDGRLEVVDPGFDTLDLLRSIRPDFDVRQAALPGFSTPRFLQAREASCGLSLEDLTQTPEAGLWEAHQLAMESLWAGEAPAPRCSGEASVLDLKVALAHRMLSNCRLCAHRCGVNRLEGEMGYCRLRAEATVVEHFVHIGEEAPINPSLVLSLAGCGLRCLYCQQGELLNPAEIEGELLESALWSRLDTQGTRSLSFVGGNPDESLYAILSFLSAAPTDWPLPVVWNSHAYATPETLQLLDGIIDAYVPDFKYGSEICGRRLSSAPDYVATAKAAISAMLTQGVPVIVRILVLPGHFACCHVPTLTFLSAQGRERLLVSLRGQYCPDHLIEPQHGEMARRPTAEEMGAVTKLIQELDLLPV